MTLKSISDYDLFPITCMVSENYLKEHWVITGVSDNYSNISTSTITRIPKSLSELLTKPSLLLFENCLLPDLILNGYCKEVFMNIQLDDSIYPVIANIRINKDADVIYWAFLTAVKRNYIENAAITRGNELAALTSELENLALTDELTGLVNRRHITQLTESLFMKTQKKFQLTVMMIDIDYFKNFNDKYGHSAGDEILVKVADILKKSLRDSDVISRFGGEEFLVIMPDAQLDSAQKLSQRIHRRLKDMELAKEWVEKITVSIGLCSAVVKDKNEMQRIITCADQALYEAKRSGRNKTCNKEYQYNGTS